MVKRVEGKPLNLQDKYKDIRQSSEEVYNPTGYGDMNYGNTGYGDVQYTQTENPYGGETYPIGNGVIETPFEQTTQSSSIDIGKISTLSQTVSSLLSSFKIDITNAKISISGQCYVDITSLGGKPTLVLIYDNTHNQTFDKIEGLLTIDSLFGNIVGYIQDIINDYPVGGGVSVDTGVYGAVTLTRSYDGRDVFEFKPSRALMNTNIKCEGLRTPGDHMEDDGVSGYGDEY